MAFLKFNKSELVNLEYSLKREIILANKTGAYCNTSIVTCNTRRYHGLLAVPVEKFDGYRHLLLSSLDESLTLRGKRFNLGIHCYGDIYEPRGHKYIVDFDADPVPTVTYKIGEIVFRKQIVLSPDSTQLFINYQLVNAPAKVKLELKPFLAFRNVHDLTGENSNACTDFKPIQSGASFCLYKDFPELNLQLSSSLSSYRHNPVWYKGVTYSDEMRRGFDCREDLLVPGTFEIDLKSGDSIVFSASAGDNVNASGLKRRFASVLEKIGPIKSYHDQLVRASDYLVRENNGRKMIVAGYSWLYTGLLRETLFSLAGLTLYGKNDPKEFEEILDNLIAEGKCPEMILVLVNTMASVTKDMSGEVAVADFVTAAAKTTLEDCVPYINGRFRTNGDNIIHGFSIGELTAAELLKIGGDTFRAVGELTGLGGSAEKIAFEISEDSLIRERAALWELVQKV